MGGSLTPDRRSSQDAPARSPGRRTFRSGEASWVITIIAFGLGVLQLLIYWFGRNFPLQVRAKGHATRMSEGQQIIRVVVEFRSRTRDTQTIREILLFDPPNVVW
jgi:hypothetical protein